MGQVYNSLIRAQKDYAKKLIPCAVLLLAACTPCPPAELPPLTGTGTPLVVEVYGFRALKGNLLLSLFLDARGFPEDTRRAPLNLSVPVTEGRMRLELPPLPPGRYSYSILHDENGNGTMDRSLLGIPREGYAFSNDLEGDFGPPEAEAAVFTLGADAQHHALRIHYFQRKREGRRGPV